MIIVYTERMEVTPCEDKSDVPVSRSLCWDAKFFVSNGSRHSANWRGSKEGLDACRLRLNDGAFGVIPENAVSRLEALIDAE